MPAHGRLLEAVDIDADRETLDPGDALAEGDAVFALTLRTKFLDEIALQIIRIALGLRADEVVVHHGAQEIGAAGQRVEHFRRGPWDVVEIADPIAHPQHAQLRRQRQQMVVVHPDVILGLHQVGERLREPAVHPQVAGIIGPRKLRQADAVMHHWPQGPVCEAAVVFLPVRRGQVHQRVLHRAALNERWRRAWICGRLAAPAEPQPLVFLESLAQRDGKSARSRLGCRIGYRNPVRDDHQSRQA